MHATRVCVPVSSRALEIPSPTFISDFFTIAHQIINLAR